MNRKLGLVGVVILLAMLVVFLPIVPSDCIRYQVNGCVFLQPPANGYTCNVNVGLHGSASISYAIIGEGGADIQDSFQPFANGAYIWSNNPFGSMCARF